MGEIEVVEIDPKSGTFGDDDDAVTETPVSVSTGESSTETTVLTASGESSNEQKAKVHYDEMGRMRTLVLWRVNTFHIRMFHLAWLSFFISFFGWFSIPPLLPSIRKDLGLTDEQVASSNILAVSGTVVFRILVGSGCGWLGPKKTQSILLAVFSLPVAAAGLCQNFASFAIVRVLISGLGSTFVVTQYWSTLLFAPEIVGLANATSAGWGNLGAGVALAVMPQLYALLNNQGHLSEEMSWRVALVFPAGFLLIAAIALWLLPETNNNNNNNNNKTTPPRETSTRMVTEAMTRNILTAILDYRCWLLFLSYACCFGVELVMNSTLSLYFVDYFSMSQETAGLISSLFGLMNLFARSFGGHLSDIFSSRFGMLGRCAILCLCLGCEGVALLLFSMNEDLRVTIVLLVLFSIATQGAEGATFAIVPFINKEALGGITGMVGSGGSAGAVFLGLLFRDYNKRKSFFIISIIVLICAGASLTIAFGRKNQTRRGMRILTQASC